MDDESIPEFVELLRIERGTRNNPFSFVRHYLRTELGLDHFPFHDRTAFNDAMQVEFGLVPDEVGQLTPASSGILLKFLHRLRTAPTEASRKGVLVEIQNLRSELASVPDLGIGGRVALKALHSPSFPPPDEHILQVERVTLDAVTRTVTFDGKTFTIANPRAFKIFKMIVDASGDIVTSDTIKEKVPGVGKSTRIGQILDDHLPKQLRRLVPGQPGQGSGFSLKLPPKETVQ